MAANGRGEIRPVVVAQPSRPFFSGRNNTPFSVSFHFSQLHCFDRMKMIEIMGFVLVFSENRG